VTRREFIAVTSAVAVPAKSYTLRAVAAAHLPHARTIRSNDPRFAQHHARGGVFEIREYANGSQILLHDSLEARWKSRAPKITPISISLYIAA